MSIIGGSFRIRLNQARLNASMARVNKLKGAQARGTLVRTVLGILKELQRKSPVDTGEFRAGWSPFLEAHGVPSSISGPNVESRAVAKGRNQSSYIDASARLVRPYVEIINGATYGSDLESGRSKKAQAGFYAGTLARWSTHLTLQARATGP